MLRRSLTSTRSTHAKVLGYRFLNFHCVGINWTCGEWQVGAVVKTIYLRATQLGQIHLATSLTGACGWARTGPKLAGIGMNSTYKAWDQTAGGILRSNLNRKLNSSSNSIHLFSFGG